MQFPGYGTIDATVIIPNNEQGEKPVITLFWGIDDTLHRRTYNFMTTGKFDSFFSWRK
jgi:hypothetical protein